MVFVSEGDKELEAGIKSVFLAARHALCVLHLAENVRRKGLWAEAVSYIYKLARARN